MTVHPSVLELPLVVALTDAINRRVEVEFVYDGLPRVVQPAALGFHFQSGKLALRGYMVAGVTRSDASSLWRLFTGGSKFEDMEVRVTDRVFAENPPGYQVNDSYLRDILAQLSV